VEFLIQLGPASSKTVPIPRSLRDSPNYSPCWRVEVFEQYLIRIAEAKDQSNAVTEILAEEGDPFIRQMLLFHFERRCLIPDSIEYAMQCRQTEAQNRIQSMVKAMVIAGTQWKPSTELCSADHTNSVVRPGRRQFDRQLPI
jgi:hypothetical protein